MRTCACVPVCGCVCAHTRMSVYQMFGYEYADMF